MTIFMDYILYDIAMHSKRSIRLILSELSASMLPSSPAQNPHFGGR